MSEATTLAPLRPEPAEAALAKARNALLLPPGLGAYVKQFAPPMPPGFWGEVRFAFQDGRFVLAIVEERAKP